MTGTGLDNQKAVPGPVIPQRQFLCQITLQDKCSGFSKYGFVRRGDRQSFHSQTTDKYRVL